MNGASFIDITMDAAYVALHEYFLCDDGKRNAYLEFSVQIQWFCIPLQGIQSIQADCEAPIQNGQTR